MLLPLFGESGCLALRVALFAVEDLHQVGGFHLEAIAEAVAIVERLRNAVGVVALNTSVLHQLNVSSAPESGRSGLSAVSHDCDLFRRVLVPHSDSALNWEEIAGDVIGLGQVEFLSLPKVLVDHLQAIGVVPKLPISMEVIQELPVHHDVFSSMVMIKLIQFILNIFYAFVNHRDVIEVNMELQEV